MPLFFDSTMFLLIPAILLSLYAQYKVRSTYAKFSRIRCTANLTGAEVAATLLHQNGIQDVDVEPVPGTLSDHYDPRDKMVRLSQENYYAPSIAGLSVAAHEVGHAIQDARGYLPLRFRHAILPIANLGSGLAFPLLLIGMILSAPSLIDLGILFFAGAVLFQVVTLPVEFNASRRALDQLRMRNYLSPEEIEGARKVLSAAALTYVAAAAVSVLELARLLLLRNLYTSEEA